MCRTTKLIPVPLGVAFTISREERCGFTDGLRIAHVCDEDDADTGGNKGRKERLDRMKRSIAQFIRVVSVIENEWGLRIIIGVSSWCHIAKISFACQRSLPVFPSVCNDASVLLAVFVLKSMYESLVTTR
jgi:hypothetical protein